MASTRTWIESRGANVSSLAARRVAIIGSPTDGFAVTDLQDEDDELLPRDTVEDTILTRVDQLMIAASAMPSPTESSLNTNVS